MSRTVPVTVAIPCYQREPGLLRTLQKIAACDPQPAEVLIFADGGWLLQIDASYAGLPSVRVIQSQAPAGPGGGRQRLIEEAAHEIVCGFDDDAWPLQPDYFQRAIELMQAFPRAAVLSPVVDLTDKPAAELGEDVWELRSYEGCASVHRRSLHLQLHGFVPIAGSYGLEESDVSLQATAAGFQVLQSNWLHAWHDRPGSDAQHGVLPWIRNELAFGWLRFPIVLQPVAWWRAVKRYWRDWRKAGPVPLLRSTLSFLPVCAQLKQHRVRLPVRAVWLHYRKPLRSWRLSQHAEGLQVEDIPMLGTVLHVTYTDPAAYPPLEHATRLQARAGWRVEVFGLLRADQGLVWLPRHGVTQRFMEPCAPGLRQKLHHLAFTLRAVWHAWHLSAEWVYCSDGFAAPAGVLAKLLLRKRVVYHEHDAPPSRPGVPRNAAERMLGAARRWLGAHGDLTVMPSARRLEVFQQPLGRPGRSAVVWNVPMLREVYQRPRMPIKQGLRVLFHGSIVPERIPLSYVEMLARCDDGITLGVIGYEPAGARGYKRLMCDAAEKLGIRHRFQCFPAVPQRRDLLEHCSGYDVGLALLAKREWDINSLHMAGASNKPFDYLSQGLAVIVPDDPEWRHLYVDTGCGMACAPEDIDALARLLNWLLAHPEDVRAMGEAGRQRCLSEWNYETKFAPVMAAMMQNA